jgi:decaprenyl-phosphate phosphoribosyltransferase
VINLTKFSYFAAVAALRPHQWTKNLVVFAAPLFAFSLTWPSFLGSLLAFVLFCCASSGFYLLNDIADVECDRRHPVKCKRPIAAGLVSIPAALGMAVVLLSSALLVGWLHSPALGATLLGYAILQVAYNLKLKHILVLDIMVIAAGFILRSYAGFVITGLPLSQWFLLGVAMLALFLAVEKRRAELQLLAVPDVTTRVVLRGYSLPLLTRMEGVVTTGAVMSYAIWSSGPQVHGATTPWMMLTLPFVLYGLFRYQLLSNLSERIHESDVVLHQGGNPERPEEIFLTDWPILLTVVGWILAVSVILWLKHQGIII